MSNTVFVVFDNEEHVGQHLLAICESKEVAEQFKDAEIAKAGAYAQYWKDRVAIEEWPVLK